MPRFNQKLLDLKFQIGSGGEIDDISIKKRSGIGAYAASKLVGDCGDNIE